MSTEATTVTQVATITRTLDALGGVILGKEKQLRLALTCLLAGGHLLIEDVPGLGKTVMAHALSNVLGLEFNRVQFTNDLLPADITGSNIYNRSSGEFVFHKGAIFTEILLADEINRATPKTQSALLEAMEERQISIEGVTWALPEPFFVIATQNPSEQLGTFPLPESQLDRFLLRISVGYPSRQSELQMLAGGDPREKLSVMKRTIEKTELLEMQAEANTIYASDALLEYLYNLVDYSRSSGLFVNGLSARASLGLLRAAKAYAWLGGADNVLPADVQAVFPALAGHRLVSRDGSLNRDNSGFAVMEAVPVI